MKLDSLLHQRADLWRGAELPSAAGPCIATGYASLDRTLAGGWPSSGLVDILCDQAGAAGLVIPALAQISQGSRWLAWVAPPYIPYPQALASGRVDLSKVLLVHPQDEKAALWAMEQALRSGSCGAVLAWPRNLNAAALRRLQLAAVAGDALAVLFRPAHCAAQTAQVPLRLRVYPVEQGWEVEVLKRRGGWPGASCHVAAPSAAG